MTRSDYEEISPIFLEVFCDVVEWKFVLLYVEGGSAVGVFWGPKDKLSYTGVLWGKENYLVKYKKYLVSLELGYSISW